MVSKYVRDVGCGELLTSPAPVVVVGERLDDLAGEERSVDVVSRQGALSECSPLRVEVSSCFSTVHAPLEGERSATHLERDQVGCEDGRHQAQGG